MLSISHGCDAIDHEAQVTESLQAMQDQWQPLGTMGLHSFAIRYDNKKCIFPVRFNDSQKGVTTNILRN